MTQLRFLLPQTPNLTADAVRRAYVTGWDASPLPSTMDAVGEELHVACETPHSLHLHVPWPTAKYGELALQTGTLVPQEGPYTLSTEIARGTLHRARNFSAEFEQSGFAAVPGVQKDLAHASEQLGAAIFGTDPADAGAAANETIARALDVNERLSRALAGLLGDDVTTRAAMPMGLGAVLDHPQLPPAAEERFRAAFSTVMVPMPWAELEPEPEQFQWQRLDAQMKWARTHGLRVVSGPLIASNARHLPAWMLAQDVDIRVVMQRFVDQLTARYGAQVHSWFAAAGMNLDRGFGLDDKTRLQLTAVAVETLRRAIGKAPIVVSVDQPWGEYLAEHPRDISQLGFADALIRADLGVTTVGLELNVGYWPGGTTPREPSEVLRKINEFAALGVPVLVLLSLPTAGNRPPRVDETLHGELRPVEGAPTGNEWQVRFVQNLVPLLLAHGAVQGVIWNQWDDDHLTGRGCWGGLWDAAGAKPILGVLEAVATGKPV